MNVIFVMNGVVKYNAYDGTLYVMDGSVDMVTLGRMTNELLCLLVKNNHQLLDREMILNELWTTRGFSASSNNLNNYISILRRTLAECGVVDVISTIPRHGFIFSAEIDVINEVDNERGCASCRVQVVNKKIRFCHDFLYSRVSHFLLHTRCGLGVLAVILFLTVLQFIQGEEGVKQDGIHFKLYKIHQCDVRILLQEGSPADASRLIPVIRDELIKRSLNCDRKASVFYFPESARSFRPRDPAGHAVFAYCAHDGIHPCRNYGVISREN